MGKTLQVRMSVTWVTTAEAQTGSGLWGEGDPVIVRSQTGEDLRTRHQVHPASVCIMDCSVEKLQN